MCRLILFPQGLTKWEREGRLRGRLDVPLSPEGVAAVTASAREMSCLAPRVVYHGPDEAGRQTAELAADHTTSGVRQFDGLAEMSLGLWQGLLIEEVKQRHPRVYRQWQENPQRVSPPEGETLAQASERARAALEKICGRHQQDTVLLVVPPLLGAVLRSLLGGTDAFGIGGRPSGPQCVTRADLVREAAGGARWELYEV